VDKRQHSSQQYLAGIGLDDYYVEQTKRQQQQQQQQQRQQRALLTTPSPKEVIPAETEAATQQHRSRLRHLSRRAARGH